MEDNIIRDYTWEIIYWEDENGVYYETYELKILDDNNTKFIITKHYV